MNECVKMVLCFLFLNFFFSRQKAIIIISNLEINTRSLTLWKEIWGEEASSSSSTKSIRDSSLLFIMVNRTINYRVVLFSYFVISLPQMGISRYLNYEQFQEIFILARCKIFTKLVNITQFCKTIVQFVVIIVVR